MELDYTSQFVDYLRYEKRLSENTIVAYQTDLQQFKDYLLGEYELEVVQEVSVPMIRSWIVALVEQKIAAVSVNRKIATLKSFFKFLRRKLLITRDPMRNVHMLKKPKRIPEFVEEDAMQRLFDEANFAETEEGLKDQLILEMLYGTGVRLSELIGLKISDIDLEAATIKVMGKRSKERVIPFTPALGKLLYLYLTRIQPYEPSDYLLTTQQGKMLYPLYVHRVVKKYLHLVTSLEKRSPHILRHTYATHLLNRGADLNAIKELLGHSSLAATQIYTHNAIEELKKSFLQAHPKA